MRGYGAADCAQAPRPALRRRRAAAHRTRARSRPAGRAPIGCSHAALRGRGDCVHCASRLRVSARAPGTARAAPHSSACRWHLLSAASFVFGGWAGRPGRRALGSHTVARSLATAHHLAGGRGRADGRLLGEPARPECRAHHRGHGVLGVSGVQEVVDGKCSKTRACVLACLTAAGARARVPRTCFSSSPGASTPEFHTILTTVII